MISKITFLKKNLKIGQTLHDMSHIMRKTCLCHMRTTKERMRSLISTYVVCCLDSIIYILVHSKISRL